MNGPVQRASLAAQVAAQARPASITPIRPVTIPPNAVPITVSDSFNRFSSLVRQERQIAGELAYLAYRLWQANEWEKLGFKDEQAVCDALGISLRWWRQHVFLGERLQHLALTEMQNLTKATMEALVAVHPSIWEEFAWIEEAKTLSGTDFLMLVAQRNSQVFKNQLVEPRCAMALRVPVSQKSILERRLETIRRQEKFSSTAEALAFALQSVDRADELSDTLAEIQGQIAELKLLYDPARLEESEAERDARLANGSDRSLTATASKAQRLLRRIDQTIGVVTNEIPAKALPQAGSGTDGKAV